MAATGRYVIGAPFNMAGTIAETNHTLDDATDALEVIFGAEAGAASYTITRLGVRQGVVTGTSPVYEISLQGVDSSGNPDGTIKSSGNARATFTPTGATDGDFRWFTLTSSYAAAPGEFLALVVKHSSGTVNSSNNCSFTLHGSNSSGTYHFPGGIQNSAGSRTRQANIPIYGWSTASTSHGFPCQEMLQTTLTDTSTPDEMGVKFTLDSGHGSTFQVAGIQALLRFGSSARTIRFQLYDSDGSTVLQSVDYDSDIVSSAASNRQTRIYFDETSLATLSFGTAYRLAGKIQDATGNWIFAYINCVDAQDAAAFDGGSQFVLTYRSDAGSWTDETNNRPLFAPIVTDWTEPAGGGTTLNVYVEG